VDVVVRLVLELKAIEDLKLVFEQLPEAFVDVLELVRNVLVPSSNHADLPERQHTGDDAAATSENRLSETRGTMNDLLALAVGEDFYLKSVEAGIGVSLSPGGPCPVAQE
jgi:hypothetical protein